MSRPREVRQAQRQCPRRHPEMYDFPLDMNGKPNDDDVIELADPYFGDAYHTMPGFGEKEKEK